MIYYRISDQSYPKVKLPGATKQVCFNNFKYSIGKHPYEVIFDNCKKETVESLVNQGINRFHETQLGNAGSFRFAMDLAKVEHRPEYEAIYFVEDDYLHLPTATIELIEEGLEIADYVTLYDHPDKYSKDYDFGEVSKVMRTKSSYWRHTISTCMTFATTVRKLVEDEDIWTKYLGGQHPHDHLIFTELHQKGRKLAVSIPGHACHCDPTWGGMEAIEDWAVDMMWNEYSKDAISNPQFFNYIKLIFEMNTSKVDKLKMMIGLLHGQN